MAFAHNLALACHLLVLIDVAGDRAAVSVFANGSSGRRSIVVQPHGSIHPRLRDQVHGAEGSTSSDLSTWQLLKALDPETSLFWSSVADAIGDKLAADREASNASATSLLQEFESVAGEHHLLVRMMGRTQNSARDPQICGWGIQEPPSKPGLRRLNAMQFETSSRWAPFYKALREFRTAIWTGVLELGRAVKFFTYAFLRWDFTIPFFGAGLKTFLPVLGFKCQPARACLNGFLDGPKALYKMVIAIGRAVWHLFKALVHAASFTEGRDDNKEDITDQREHVVDIPLDANEADIDAGQVLFTDDNLGKDPCIKHLRFKGSIGVDFFKVGKIKLMFGTVPLPIEKWKGEIATCVRKVTRQIKSFLMPAKLKEDDNTKKYFTASQCNPHTVGLCMMLEKSRKCGIKLDQLDKGGGPVIIPNAPTKKKDHMLRICDFFSDVTLHLTKATGKVRCTETWRLHQEEKLKRNVNTSSLMSSTINFEQGCRMVAERMKETAQCPAPKTPEEAFVQCRRLFACTHQKPQEQTLLRWDDYVARVMDMVSENVQMKRDHETARRVAEIVETVGNKGRAFQGLVEGSIPAAVPPEPSELKPEWLFTHPLWHDNCFANLEGVWEGGTLPGRYRRHRFWDIRREFYTNHKSRKSEVAATPAEKKQFMYRLSHGLQVNTWSNGNDGKWCESAALTAFTEPPAVPVPVARIYKYSVVQLMIGGSDWGVQFAGNDRVTFTTPGWVGKSTELTISKRPIKSKGTSAIVPTWTLAACNGRLCADLPEEMKETDDPIVLRALRLTMPDSNNEMVTKLCKAATQVLDHLKPFLNVLVEHGEDKFEKAAMILEANAVRMKANENRGDQPETVVNWDELGDLMGMGRLYAVIGDPSRADDPFESLDDHENYFDEKHKDGTREKLGLFLRRRQWTIVLPITEGGASDRPELRLRGVVPSHGQVLDLATALRSPRLGPIMSTSKALHEVAVDLLSGLKHEMLYWPAEQKDTVSSLQQLRPRPCGLALVNFEFHM